MSVVMFPDEGGLRGVIDSNEERVARLQETHRIADCARAYVAARKRNEDAEPCDWERFAVDVDFSWHRLLVACGYGEPE